MRIRWNRHLDTGTSSRHQEDGAGTQEADEKKKSSSSSPGIFKIFRRKKSRRRGEDDSKTDGSNGSVAPAQTEVDEDDSASVSSVATCASQPATEGFQRDRASSLFSSFRLSLPGSKRKKRKIAPTPEAIFNGPENQQLERYSTPDLRKTTEKSNSSNSVQASLSTSSPSIRNPKGSSASAQSLQAQNQECLGKPNWSSIKSVTSSSAKLSKSVSFSDCGDDLTDHLHSTRDNKAPWAVNSTAMVEENCRALESELPDCITDIQRFSRESNFTTPSDSANSAVGVSSVRQDSCGASGSAVMKNPENPGDKGTNSIEEKFTNTHNVTNDTSSELRSAEMKVNSISSHECKLATTSMSYDCVSENDICDNDFVTEPLNEKSDKENNASVKFQKLLDTQTTQTPNDSSSAHAWNTHSRRYVDSSTNSMLSDEKEDTVCQSNLVKPNNYVSLNKKLEVLSSEISVLTASNDLSIICSSGDNNNGAHISKSNKSELCDSEKKKSDTISVDKQIPAINTKHVLCHMRVYENENSMQESEDSKSNDKQVSDISLNNLCQDSLFEKDSSTYNSQNRTVVSKDTFISEPNYKANFNVENSNSNHNSSKHEQSFFNLSCESRDSCDQKVPDTEFYNKDFPHQTNQQVPDFELSLLEFEEICNKYMSHSNPELAECSFKIPYDSYSPKRKSVLDLNTTFTYPKVPEHFGADLALRSAKRGKLSASHSDLISQNIEINSATQHQSSCQTVTDKYSLPTPPKQWINYEKSIDNESIRDACTGGVQCTMVHGKNLCQEPCLKALPTTVMHGDSDLGGIDTPQLSSTLQTSESKSGRKLSTNVAVEKQHLSDDQTSAEMISDVGLPISTLNGVLDYSYESEISAKPSVYLDPEIKNTYRGPRAICDPLVYSTEVAKGLESLGPENYLNGHNFSDMRSVGFSDVISDVSRDYVQAGKGLIEISNPYAEDIFIRDLSHRNYFNNITIAFPKGSAKDASEKVSSMSCDDVQILTATTDDRSNLKACEVGENNPKAKNYKSNCVNEVSASVNDASKTSTHKLERLVLNGREQIKSNKLSHVDQKNLKNKSSLIPCRKKGPSDIENKKAETKLKSKKSNSLPRFIKSESHLPVQRNNSSHRVFSNSGKDSSVGLLNGKQKDKSLSKINGSYSNIPPSNSDFTISELDSNTSICLESDNYPSEENRKCNLYSSSALDPIFSDPENGVVAPESDCNSFVSDFDDSISKKNGLDDQRSVISSASTDNIPSLRELEIHQVSADIPTVKLNGNCKITNDSADGNSDACLPDQICFECLNMHVPELVDIPTQSVKYHPCSKHLDISESGRRSSLPFVVLRKTSLTSSKESLNSQLTSSSNRGISRIPRILSKIKRSVSGTFTTKRNRSAEQTGSRVTQSSKGPVRPPMWLSKAELTQEIQRLGTLCEARTKELNRLKMETKHVSSGFDAFASLFKYMVEDLNGLSVPALTQDLEKTLKQLELTKQDLAYYEREVEEMKSHHCQELNDLSNKLFEVYQSEVAELNAKHQEEINHLKSDHQKQIELLTVTFETSSAEAKAHHEKMVVSLEQEIINQREELQEFHGKELKDLEEKHAASTKVLQEHIEQLQKKCAELKQHSMSMEDAMQKDTDSKLQWVTTAKLDLEKEVESLKAVLEMKNKELHTIRVQNLEMEKQLEELPLAREKIKMLQARAEDLEALMIEKTNLERKLSTENQQIKDTYEKEAKINRRLSMENEELQWRLRQAENSLISGSFSEVPEFPEAEENAAVSPSKSPGPQHLSRSVFFTFVDKDENLPHSPRTPYKKITPNFAANYKTSPAKTSKSPPVPSPRRGKSHSEPPQPPNAITSTPRKTAKQQAAKSKSAQKRQRSGSDSGRLGEHAEANSSSVTESMASSVSSESSVFEQQERLLEQHREHIIHSLEILREQRSTENDTSEHATLGKKWRSDDIKITGELSRLETEDMSRSAEFSDPKTYYHMTFPVLKESGVTECDIEDSSKNSTNGSSPMKEVAPSSTMHSMSESNINSAVEALQVTRLSSQVVSSAITSTTTVTRVERKSSSSSTEKTLSAENVQTEASSCSEVKTENRWRTI